MKKHIISSLIALGLVVSMTVPAFAGTWIKDGSNWKYYNDNGQAATSEWISYNDSWYYIGPSGAMLTGWIKVKNDWYFLHDDGTMAHDTWVDNYYLNGSGKWTESR